MIYGVRLKGGDVIGVTAYPGAAAVQLLAASIAAIDNRDYEDAELVESMDDETWQPFVTTELENHE